MNDASHALGSVQNGVKVEALKKLILAYLAFIQ